MTKEEARNILENWINEQSQDTNGEHIDMRLPIVDERVYSKMSFDVSQTIYEEWTFKGLIKLVYDLDDVR